MHPVFQKLKTDPDNSFVVEHSKFEYFPHALAFHPEIEILEVIQGSGTLFVGDYIGNFNSGDLILIGSNVPHLWHSEEKYIQAENQFTEVIFIGFNPEIFDNLFQLPEAKNIVHLVKMAQRGIRVTGKVRDDISALMKSISMSRGVSRITLLLSILELFSSIRNPILLSGPAVNYSVNNDDMDRLNKVYKYVIENHHNEILLSHAASIANLSTPAFCRYFKKRTNKTFIQFLTEIRIRYACKLLMGDDNSVSRVCYSSGFSNISYFIKQFQRITGLTPLNYKKKYANINP